METKSARWADMWPEKEWLPTTRDTLARRLDLLNPILRGWGYFYRHTWMAFSIFSKLDHYVWWTILRWVRKKHPTINRKALFRRYGWRKPRRRAFYFRDGKTVPFELKRIQQKSFSIGMDEAPGIRVNVEGEPGA